MCFFSIYDQTHIHILPPFVLALTYVISITSHWTLKLYFKIPPFQRSEGRPICFAFGKPTVIRDSEYCLVSIHSAFYFERKRPPSSQAHQGRSDPLLPGNKTVSECLPICLSWQRLNIWILERIIVLTAWVILLAKQDLFTSKKKKKISCGSPEFTNENIVLLKQLSSPSTATN